MKRFVRILLGLSTLAVAGCGECGGPSDEAKWTGGRTDDGAYGVSEWRLDIGAEELGL